MNYFIDTIQALQWFFLLYFIAVSTGYLLLNVMSFFSMRRYLDSSILGDLPRAYSDFKPPISLLVPAYNEESTIVASIHSLLQLSYYEYEIIVINDGSKDGTLAALQHEFDLIPFAEAYWQMLPTKPERGIWR